MARINTNVSSLVAQRGLGKSQKSLDETLQRLSSGLRINRGADDWPIFVANSRFKMDTGSGPFDIRRNIAGIAEQVPLGSGFMGIQGGFSVMKLSDPAVLYGSVNLIYQLPKDINQEIGGVHVGRVPLPFPGNAGLVGRSKRGRVDRERAAQDRRLPPDRAGGFDDRRVERRKAANHADV